MSLLNDHTESEQFTYSRSWSEIEEMLDKAERVKNKHQIKLEEQKERGNKKKAMHHAKNMKALEGVIKTLRWTLGDRRIGHPLE